MNRPPAIGHSRVFDGPTLGTVARIPLLRIQHGHQFLFKRIKAPPLSLRHAKADDVLTLIARLLSDPFDLGLTGFTVRGSVLVQGVSRPVGSNSNCLNWMVYPDLCQPTFDRIFEENRSFLSFGET